MTPPMLTGSSMAERRHARAAHVNHDVIVREVCWLPGLVGRGPAQLPRNKSEFFLLPEVVTL